MIHLRNTSVLSPKHSTLKTFHKNVPVVLPLCAWCGLIDASLSNRGALKYQLNVESHPPGCIHTNLSSHSLTNHRAAGEKESGGVCREEARFQTHFPQVRNDFCVFVVIPLCKCVRLLIFVCVYFRHGCGSRLLSVCTVPSGCIATLEAPRNLLPSFLLSFIPVTS